MDKNALAVEKIWQTTVIIKAF